MEALIQTMLRGLRLQTKCHTRHLGTTYDKLSQMGDKIVCCAALLTCILCIRFFYLLL